MFVLQKPDDIPGLQNIVQSSLMLGIRAGQQAQQAEQQKKEIVNRLLLQDQLQRSRGRESDRRRSYSNRINAGWKDVTPSVTSMIGPVQPQPAPEGAIPGQYGHMWLPPGPPQLTDEQQEGYDVIKGSAPGDYTVKQKPRPKHQVGDTREIKSGDKVITQELTKEKGWINKYEAPRWEDDATTKKPEVKPSEALKRISAIKKSKATLDKTSTVDRLLAAAYPGLEEGQKVTEAQKQELYDAWDREIAYLEQFVTGKPAATSPGKTYTYTETGELLKK